MYKRLRLVGLVVTCVYPLLVTSAVAVEESLDIDPQFQRTAVWCWVAVSEMVFRHFDVANVNPVGEFQCGIVGAMAVSTWAEACSQNCFQPQCQVPAGSAQYLVHTLEEYPRRAATAEQTEQPRIRASHVGRALRFSEVESEIDDGNPIIAGISPSGGSSAGGTSQHVALIEGYDDDAKTLLVNDPFPFNLTGSSNPYLQVGATELELGRYQISYAHFVDHLRWRETIKVWTSGDVSPQELPEYCCTTATGRMGPYPNPSPGGTPVLEGQTCFGNTPWGQVFGRACY